jgi:integrase
MPYKRDRSKGKYWYWIIKRDGTKSEHVYRRSFVHADGVMRELTAKNYKDWGVKTVQHFIDAKRNPNGAGSNYKNATYAKMFSGYLKVVESKRSVGTYIKIKAHFDRDILPYFKNHVISKTTNEELVEFAENLTEAKGALVTKEVFKVLSTFMNWCKKKKCFTENPIDDDLRESIRENRKDALKEKRQRENEFPLATVDIERMFDNVKGRDDEIVYHFMAHACRLGEALGVKVKDVNLFNKTVTLTHQVQSYPMHMLKGTRYLEDDAFNENSSTVVLDQLKTEESHGTLQLIPETVELLVKLIANKDSDDLIFTTRNGTPCTPNNFRNRHWKPMLKKLGVSHKVKLTPHVMRGYVFSKGVASGQDSAALSKALRHRQISTTLKNYFPNIEDDKQVNPLGHMSGVINSANNIEKIETTDTGTKGFKVVGE